MSNKTILLTLLFILQSSLLLVQSVKTVFKDCGSVNGNIQSVDVSGCNAIPCPLVRGTNVTLTVTFTSKVSSKTTTNYMYGIIAGVPVPYVLPEDDGCKLGISCPIQPSQTYTENAVFPVFKNYPLLSLYVKLELKSDDTNDIACLIIPCQIVDK